MYGKLKDFLTQELANIKAAGLYKNERIITTPQRADIKVNAGSDVLNFCANNYLGLSDNQRLIKAAKEAMDTHGYGMSSVRFICGTGSAQTTGSRYLRLFQDRRYDPVRCMLRCQRRSVRTVVH